MDILFSFLNKQSKSFLLILGYLLFLLLGILDYLTGPDLSPLVFYLIPIVIVTWFVGRQAGVVMSIASAIAWFMADFLSTHSLPHAAIPYLNIIETLGVFLVVTLTISTLRRVEDEKVRREFEIAREVQAYLFPHSLPKLKTLEYTGICNPASIVSGDYYDFLLIEPSKLGIAVGDISGKGVSAALLMANLQGLLRSYAQMHTTDVRELMNDINRSLCASTDPSKYGTLFYGIYDDRDRTLTYANAGHNPPMLIRSQVEPEGEELHVSQVRLLRPLNEQEPDESVGIVRLETGGTAVGMFPDSAYSQETLHLYPADVLVVFTDGISDARNSLKAAYGEDRLVDLVMENRRLSAKEIRRLILEDLSKYVGAEPQFDDVTLVVGKVI